MNARYVEIIEYHKIPFGTQTRLEMADRGDHEKNMRVMRIFQGRCLLLYRERVGLSP